MAAGDVFKVVLNGHQWDQRTINVLYFRGTAPDSDAELLATAVRAWRQGYLEVTQSQQHFPDQIDVYPIIPFGIIPYTILPQAGMRGDATAPVFTQIAAVVAFKSNSTSRRANGRIYIPGMAASNFSQDFLSNDGMNRLTANFAAFQTMFAAGGGEQPFEHIIWSRVTAGPVAPFNPAAATPVVRYVVRKVAYTQRRRTWGVGI